MKIDFHAHILPHVDHGCHSTAMAEQQLRLMKAAGTDAVVATSHFYPERDSVASYLAKRQGALEALRKRLPLDELPKIYPAAEVLVCPGLDRMARLEELCIVGTNIILLEMPFIAWNDDLPRTVRAIKRRGMQPVLAHINRYPIGPVDELLKDGILAQVNAEAFGLFKNAKPYIERMKEGKVVALGSDLHEAKSGDYRRFTKMCKALGSTADIVFAASEKLLKDAKPLPTEEPVPQEA